MKKTNYFKIGAFAYMLLGTLHIVSQLMKDGLSEHVLQALAIMKETSFDFMGQHNLLQFYTGFSITMGFMIFAFGLQAFVINKPTILVALVNTLVSVVASIFAIVYFHPLAYSFLLFSMLCFAVSFVQLKKHPEQNSNSK